MKTIKAFVVFDSSGQAANFTYNVPELDAGGAYWEVSWGNFEDGGFYVFSSKELASRLVVDCIDGKDRDGIVIKPISISIEDGS